MSERRLSAEQVAQFHEDGYLFVEGFLDAEETRLLTEACRADARMQRAAMDVRDAAGRRTNLSLWNHPGDDLYGVIARSQRAAGGMAQLLGDEVYHYHSKLSAKDPKVGGAWEWHQDYGYWYHNGCLYPDMASLFLAIDPCTRANGCMEVIRGSHKLGRIEHGKTGTQTGADPERVEQILTRLEKVYCEMAPGTGLFFHGNTLHCSAANLSAQPRWGLICCYNTKHNDPVIEHHHPRYTPLAILPDSAIKATGAKPTAAGQRFLRREEEKRVEG